MTTTKGLYELFQKDTPPDKTLYQIEDYAVLETLRRHFLNILNAFNIHHILNMPNILNRAECRGNDRLILLFLPH